MTGFIRNIFVFLLLMGFIRSNGQSDSIRFYGLLDEINNNLFDSAFVFETLEEANNLAKGSKNKRFIADYNQTMGVVLYNHGLRDKIGDYWKVANRIYKELQDSNKWARTERLLGVYYDSKGDLVEAMHHFSTSRDLYKAVGNRKGLGESYISLAIMNQRINKYDNALENNYLALQIAIEEGNDKVIPPIYSNMGSLYNAIQKYDSAMKYFHLALEILMVAENPISLRSVYHNMGTVEMERGNLRKALEYYFQSLEMKGGIYNNESRTGLMTIGLCYIGLNMWDSADYYLQMGLKMSLEEGHLLNIKECYDFLERVEEGRGNYQKALEYNKLHLLYLDSARNQYFDEELREMIALKELDRKTEAFNELQIEKEKNEELLKNNQKWLNRSLSLAILLLFATGFLIYFLVKIQSERKKLAIANYELDQKTNDLEMYSNDLERVIREKNDLVSVLAHDLRSPFTKIQSIVQLFEYSNDDHERKSYLRMMGSISREGLSLIQDLIDLSRFNDSNLDDGHIERIKEFRIADIIQKLIKGIKAPLAAKDLEVELDLCDNTIYNREDYCERICDNLISNALKYSKPEGKIRIKAEVRNVFMVITITDNGPGFKEEDLPRLFKRFSRLSARPTGIESSTGLGLYIARQLAKSIKGEIHLVSNVGEPASFEIRIPLDLEKHLNS